MKLILRDYIRLLKEDGELDKLLVELLFAMSIEPKSRPQKGRQFGVDIAAFGLDFEDYVKKVFLISVKQGDLTRENWDSGKNSIRQSINEITDVYIRSKLTASEKKYPKKIIFAFNGIIEQTALDNWKNYIEKLKEDGIELIDWDIDKITLLVEKYLFNESLLPKETILLLRKSLAFIDINDYDLSHVTKLFNQLLAKNENEKIAQRQKRLRLLNICLNIIFKWSEEQNNIRNSLLSAEKASLIVWKYLLDAKLLENKNLFIEIFNIFNTLEQIQYTYLKKTIRHCFVKDSFSYLGKLCHSEYCLICYEFIGIYATIGLNGLHKYDMLHKQTDSGKFKKLIDNTLNDSKYIANALYNFINNNAGSKYPQYDEHCIDICLALLLLYRTNKLNEAKDWLSKIVSTINMTYKSTSFFPLFYKNHDELIESHVNGNRKEQKSSILLTYLAEWCVILKDESTYQDLRALISQHFPDINLQLWYPTQNIEESLFTQNSDSNYGKTKHSIKLHESMLDYENEMKEELNMERLNHEKDISIFKNQFSYLGLIASRHYRTLVFPIFWRSLLS